MKLLFISNYFPPSIYGGGYMQLCEEVADGLARKGHDITVLTSTYRHGDEPDRPYPVHRLLPIDPDWHSGRPAMWQFFVGRMERERQAISAFGRLVASTKPDIVFVWHTVGLSRLMLQAAENLHGTVTIYYLADYWPELPDEYGVYWKKPPVHWIARLIKPPLSRIALNLLSVEGKPIPLEPEHTICVSDYVRQRLVSQGLISSNAVTIHNGVDISQFSSDSRAKDALSGSLRCLVAGRLIPEKGIHTVVEAFHLLRSEGNLGGLSLSILGEGDPIYLEQLYEKVNANNLGSIVEFLPPIPREQMPEVLLNHDVLIASSEYHEPLARMVQEAMSCGMIVVGTTTGGSGEILVDGVNALTFTAGDAADLARQLKRLIGAPVEYRMNLANVGRKTVVESFNISQTVFRIEKHLLELTTPQNQE